MAPAKNAMNTTDSIPVIISVALSWFMYLSTSPMLAISDWNEPPSGRLWNTLNREMDTAAPSSSNTSDTVVEEEHLREKDTFPRYFHHPV